MARILFREMLSIVLVLLCCCKNTTSQPNYTITLRVEDETAFEAYHDEPIIFSVSLIDFSVPVNKRWNKEVNERLEELEKGYQNEKLAREDFEAQKKKILALKRTIKIDTVGSVHFPWPTFLRFEAFTIRDGKDSDTVVANLPIKRMASSETDPIAIMDEDGYYNVDFAISPEDLSAVKAGNYHIKVSLTGKQSNEVNLRIKEKKMPPAVLRKEGMLIKLGRYYLQTNKLDNAMGYAEQILERDRNSIAGLVLSGEIKIAQGSYTEALNDIKNALTRYNIKYPNQLEPPEYLFALIGWLEGKAEIK